MGFGDDEEILQDFLVEAGEILETLSEQLVELEQRPDDTDLLNSIFRGFHTVKGGAGFLQLEPMVECCHATENLFDVLRNGQLTVTPELMDVVLQALDRVNQQFAEISQGEEPSSSDPELIASLKRLVEEDTATQQSDSQSQDTQEPPLQAGGSGDSGAEGDPRQPANDPAGAEPGDITDREFEQLLDAIADEEPDRRGGSPSEVEVSAGSTDSDDIIDEDEFEALLDELHGPGQGPGTKAGGSNNTTDASGRTLQEQTSPESTSGGKNPDEIDDDEFEALLDELHGKGKAPRSPVAHQTGSGDKAETPTGKSEPENLISDDEFESLLDELHGRGKGPSVTNASAKAGENKPSEPQSNAEPQSNKLTQSQTKAAKPAGKHQSGSTQTNGGKRSEKPGGNAPAAVETSVRVDTQRLDDIMNMVGELVLVRNRLVRLGDDILNENLAKAVSNLDVVTADLQASVMKTRMQPIKKVFGRFPRVVRDLARSLKKEINLELVGEDTDLDKNLVEALSDPLVHLVRNSVDHGIELPEEREAKGKDRVGKVVLSAEQEADHILLAITDDGGGMDADKLREIAVEKGLMDSDSAQRLSDPEAFNLIFAPGFSTKKEISDVSGRGVGMDVVKTKITQLNGTIEIQSTKGEGTRLNIKVPLTLAIMPTLMVTIGDQAFALPLASVQEIFHMDMRKTNVVDGQECVTIRDRAIPVFYLRNWLVPGQSVDKKREAHVVIVAIGTRMMGFVVDKLIGQEEVVIKPLGKMLQGTPGMADPTITGDGTMALILDIPGLLKHYAGGV